MARLETDTRFLDALPPDVRKGVVLVGVGAVGSHVAYILGKQGFPIQAYDPDVVGPENVGAQAFGVPHIGLHKTQAMMDLLQMVVGDGYHRYNGYNCEMNSELLMNNSSSAYPILILTPDSMAVRAELTERALNIDEWMRYWGEEALAERSRPRIIIDARVALDFTTVLTCKVGDKDSEREYLASLHSDAEASVEPCRARMLASTAISAAATICAIVKAFCLGQEVPRYVNLDMKTFLAQGWDGTRKVA